MLLKLQPTWVNLGGSFTIECRVPDVVPLEKLTLTLLHGNRTLHKKTFAGATAGLQEALTIHNTTAHREDGNHNFSCKAELDLKSLGKSSIWKVSEPQMLKVHGEREPPRTEGGKERALIFGLWGEIKTLVHSLPAQGPHT